MATCASWTFGNLRADEKGLKPMPIEGTAGAKYATKATTWWGAQTFAIKAAIIGGSLTVLLLIIIIPIVVASSGGDDDAAAASDCFEGVTPGSTAHI